MGGGAFLRATARGEPTLSTPRLSPETYRHLRTIHEERLQAHCPGLKLGTLIEAPEKQDYGDIDFVLASDNQVDFIILAESLGARGLMIHNVDKCTLGVPVDGSKWQGKAVLYSHVNHDNKYSAEVTEEPYAQIDIDVVPSALYEWHTFYASYGDMAGLLGRIVRNLGFTVSDKGLWLRMPELDISKSISYQNIPDKQGMLLLSHQPEEVMEFLGLSVKTYNAGFGRLAELYTWLGQCKLLHPHTLQWKRDNAHEQHRAKKRPVLSQFFNEWVPQNVSYGPFNNASASGNNTDGITTKPEAVTGTIAPDAAQLSPEVLHLRAGLTEEAVDFFHKRPEYEIMREKLVHALDSATASYLLKPIIALHSGRADKSLNEIVRAFRRYVGVGSVSSGLTTEAGMYILETPHTDNQSELWKLLAANGENGADKVLRDEKGTKTFVAERWHQIRDLERSRNKTTKAKSINGRV